MTGLELVFLGIATLFVFGYSAVLFKSWRIGLVLALVSLPALFLALVFTSQFLMIDAIEKMEETTEMPYSALDSWLSGYRTTYAFLALIMRYRSLVVPQLPNLYLQSLVKLLHWMIGFALLGWIHWLLDRHFVDRGSRTVFFLIYLYTALLLPTNATALKFYNYDLLSMLFAVLAILYIVLGLKHNNRWNALVGVVVATLAAQEKLVAAPVLILALIALAYIGANTGDRMRALDWGLRLPAWSLLGLLTTVGVGAISYGTVALTRTEPMPISFGVSVLGPAVSVNRLLSRFIFRVAGRGSLISYVQSIAVDTLIISLAAAALLWAGKSLSEKSQLRLRSLLYDSALVLAGVVIVVGMLGTLTLTVYEAPARPIPAGFYVPASQFNGVTEYYGARTALGHTLAYVGSGYSDFMTAVPTICWIALLISLIASFRRRKAGSFIVSTALIAVSLLMPLGYLASGIALNPRYLNIPLFMLILGIDLSLVNSLSRLTVSRQHYATFGVIVLLVAELLPFSPILGPFRPVWDWFQYHPDDVPQSGVLSGSWQGYGVEIAVASTMLEYYCLHPQNNDIASQIDCGSFTLYFSYPGRWLRESRMLDTAQTGLTPRSEITQQDLYLFSRRDIELSIPYGPRDRQRGFHLPTSVEPLMRVEYMGLVDAWIFRIDELDRQGVDYPG